MDPSCFSLISKHTFLLPPTPSLTPGYHKLSTIFIILSFQQCYRNVFKQYVAFWYWLFSFSKIPLSYIQVVVSINNLFLCIAVNPWALKGKVKHQLPVFWLYSKKTSAMRILFLDWSYWCFVPEVRKYVVSKSLPFKVLLILDNIIGHPEPHSYTVGRNLNRYNNYGEQFGGSLKT